MNDQQRLKFETRLNKLAEKLHRYMITPESRREVKAIYYGIAYGFSASTLATKANISIKDAEDIIQWFFSNSDVSERYL